MIAITTVTAPTSEPVTLTEAKLHLKVDDTADDNLITMLITAARQSCENYTWAKFFTGTYELTLDEFPDIIEIPLAPVASITSITYYNTANVSTVLSASSYLTALNGSPARVSPVTEWPEIYDRPGCVVVRFQAGYSSTAAIPAAIKQAILLLIGHYYENREGVVIGKTATEIPMTIKWLLDPYRNYAH